MSCTPCTPPQDEFPIFCDPNPATDVGQRLLVEDEAFCTKALVSPETGSTLVWEDGIKWKDGTGFNETTPFLATGTTEPRNLVTRFADVVNVLDFGADPTGTTSSSTAIQNALNIATSTQKPLYFPSGNYSITNTITINYSVSIIGDGSSITKIINNTANQDAIVIASTTTGQFQYLENCNVSGISIARNTEATFATGAGLRLTRIGKSNFTDLKIINNPEGLVVDGGEINSFSNVYVHYYNTTLDVSSNNCLLLSNSPTSGSTYQPVYTTSFVNCFFFGGYRQDTIQINSTDGVEFSNCYISSGKNANLRLKLTNTYIAACHFSNCYFDGGNIANSGSGIVCDTTGGQSIRVKFTNCDIANYSKSGFVLSSRLNQLQITNCEIYNCNEYGLFSSDTGSARIQISNSLIHDTLLGGIKINNANVVSLSQCQFLTIPTTGVQLTGTISRVVDVNNVYLGVTTRKSITATVSEKIIPESGSFTPVIKFGTTEVTYTSREGSYSTSFDGSYVQFSMHVIFTKGAATGAISITGLPFDVDQISSVSVNTGVSVGEPISARALESNEILLYKSVGGTQTILQNTDFPASSTYISIGGVYKI